MIRMILFFVFLWIVVTTGINIWRQMKGKQKLKTIKSVAYGFFTACVTFGLIVLMVILF
jgi:hypothetical protein